METPAPARIVSLVPSLTELVFWLGKGDALVGRTRFCTEPQAEVTRVPVVGGTKNPKTDHIVALQPDLVLANREENRREDVESLRAAGVTVLVTDPGSLAEAADMVEEIGELLGAGEAARALASETRGASAEGTPGGPGLRVFVAVWNEPLMGLGGESYGDSVLEAAGALNVLAARPRYPEVSLVEVASLRPDLILLPDEPFPFAARHTARFAAVAPTQVVDGKLLWWYGPRMPMAVRALRELFGGNRDYLARD